MTVVFIAVLKKKHQEVVQGLNKWPIHKNASTPITCTITHLHAVVEKLKIKKRF